MPAAGGRCSPPKAATAPSRRATRWRLASSGSSCAATSTSPGSGSCRETGWSTSRRRSRTKAERRSPRTWRKRRSTRVATRRPRSPRRRAAALPSAGAPWRRSAPCTERRRATWRSRRCPPGECTWRAASRRRSCPSCGTAGSAPPSSPRGACGRCSRRSPCRWCSTRTPRCWAPPRSPRTKQPFCPRRVTHLRPFPRDPMPTLKPELEKKAIDTIRFLAVDAVENANSGHPGMPMGAAPMAQVLWTRHLRFNPKDPRWPNRDRFVLSAGHGSMLLYALLHLAGFDVTLEDLKKFRQLHSRTPGHPEFRDTPGVEATTGPLGQGIANAVGMALSQRMLAARVGGDVIDNYVYGICSDGDLMEGVSGEASSLAGHLRLGNLIFLYDDNRVSLAGHTDVTFTEDRLERYDAYGWHTQQIEDGNDTEAIDRAIRAAKEEKDRPSLIAVRTVIGYGSPNKADTHEVHGSPLGKDEVRLTKQKLGWPLEPTFLVPDEVRAFWAARVEELKKGYDAWQQKLAQLRKDPARARSWDQYANREVPGDLPEQLAGVVAGAAAAEATRKVSQAVIQKVAELVPNLVGGSADLDPSTFTSTAWERSSTASPTTASSSRSAPRSSCSATTCARRSGWPRSPGCRACSSTRTTRSSWARTGRPTNPSSSSPRCEPSRTCRSGGRAIRWRWLPRGPRPCSARTGPPRWCSPGRSCRRCSGRRLATCGRSCAAPIRWWRRRASPSW